MVMEGTMSIKTIKDNSATEPCGCHVQRDNGHHIHKDGIYFCWNLRHGYNIEIINCGPPDHHCLIEYLINQHEGKVRFGKEYYISIARSQSRQK